MDGVHGSVWLVCLFVVFLAWVCCCGLLLWLAAVACYWDGLLLEWLAAGMACCWNGGPVVVAAAAAAAAIVLYGGSPFPRCAVAQTCIQIQPLSFGEKLTFTVNPCHCLTNMGIAVSCGLRDLECTCIIRQMHPLICQIIRHSSPWNAFADHNTHKPPPHIERFGGCKPFFL